MPKKPNGYWTFDRCASEAQKYVKRSSFERGSPSAYIKSLKNKWIDEICSHMTSPQRVSGYWTFCRCYHEARKYSTSTKFEQGSSGAHDAVRRQGWLNLMTAHMVSPQAPKGYWSDERVIELGVSCSSAADMIEKSRYAYRLARRKGLSEAFANFNRVNGDSDTVYLWVSDVRKGSLKLCKPGVTSQRLGMQRIDYVAASNGIKVSEVLFMTKSDNAFSIECEILSIGRKCTEYSGSGFSEFRWMSDIEINAIKEKYGAA